MLDVKSVRVHTRYPTDDPECMTDYCEVQIFLNEDDTPTRVYGDDYHDSGREKAAGFLDALRDVFGSDLEVESTKVADYES